jgi:hypothetical protein
MIAVTGMHRSGTSCITGLLSRCGFSLGDSHRLLIEPRFDNQKGHFENINAVLLNDRVLETAGGSWCMLPSESRITAAGTQFREHYFGFGSSFNGDVFKDPRVAVTIPLWERFCPQLRAIVFCVRNPLAVAVSLRRRNNMPLEQGLSLWFEYNVRFLNGLSRLPVVVVDYDSLQENRSELLSQVAGRLGKRISAHEVEEATGDFYSAELNHAPSQAQQIESLPEAVRALYNGVVSLAVGGRAKVSA